MVGKMHILDVNGDTVVEFDTEKADTVKHAEELFDQLRGKGYMGWKVLAAEVDSPARRPSGTMIRKFEPSERIILTPALVGG